MDNEIKPFLSTLPESPGVYRMFSLDESILYVGKARNLKKRVSSYYRQTGLSDKTQALMTHVVRVEVTLTTSENEALLLESNLIKAHQPRYNILLRDDKSYPYLFLSTEDPFPRLSIHRGKRIKKGQYFGPYPSALSVKETLNFVQKIFSIRNCDKHYFNLRSRPCLQYQIKRCTAPCVGLVSAADYTLQCRHVALFLSGKNKTIIRELVTQMEAASANLAFEQAASLRNQIARLRKLQTRQFIDTDQEDTDIIALAQHGLDVVVSVLSIRQGRLLGHRNYYPKVPAFATLPEVLDAFLSQHYSQLAALSALPCCVVLSMPLKDKAWLVALLSHHLPNKKCRVISSHQEKFQVWRVMAQKNADHALLKRRVGAEQATEKLLALTQALGMERPLARLCCFDVSHTQGEATVASFVVYDGTGALTKDYRRFNLKLAQRGDDYAGIYQAVHRAFSGWLKRDKTLPDLVVIDGGKGQLGAALRALDELSLDLPLLAVAKGNGRKPGLEQFFFGREKRPLLFSPEGKAMHLLQFIRDESHRFAITGHRKQRDAARKRSVLEDIPGVGPVRRRALLNHFGGLQLLKNASERDLAKVPGINQALAAKIYAVLR